MMRHTMIPRSVLRVEGLENRLVPGSMLSSLAPPLALDGVFAQDQEEEETELGRLHTTQVEQGINVHAVDACSAPLE